MRSVLILALALAACSSGEVVVEEVTPDPIAARTAATVTVHGAGYVNSLRGSVDNQPFLLLNDWTVTVGAIAATLVTRVDEGTLSVELPPLDEGSYDVMVRRPDGKSGTLPDGLRVAGDDLGMPGDLGSTDQSVGDAGPPDLLLADLSNPTDMPPLCNPPSLPSAVGPGPNLGITLSGVKLNGVNNFAHVAAGGKFSVTANYKINDTGGNIDQIIIGIAPSNPQKCLFNAVVPAGGSMGTATVMDLVAPTQPGTYTLRFHYGQDTSCNLSWWTINGAPTSAEDFAAICVP